MTEEMLEPRGDEPAPGRYVRPQDIDNRSTLWQRFLWRIEALAWDLLYWERMKSRSAEEASDLGAKLMRRLGPLTAAHRTTLRNIRLAFPDWDEAGVNTVALRAWENVGRIAGEMPHLADFDPDRRDGRLVILGEERLEHIERSGRPAVIISGHFANWELVAAVLSRRLSNCQITYRAANNPFIDRRIARARYAYGVHVLTPKGAGTRDLMRALSRGRAVALMNDQKFNQGIPAPFFGHEAMTAPGPSRLALRYGCPLIPVTTSRIGPARYCVTVHDPIEPPPGLEGALAVSDMVARINRFMEARIREAPDQWFWMHNRWPKEAWVKAGVMNSLRPGG